MACPSKSVTCCFSGHRPEKMPFPNAHDVAVPDTLQPALTSAISLAVASGCVNFITGMSRGFDLWAAQTVLALRRKYPALTLHCAIPYDGQATQWDMPWREVYQAVLVRSDSINILSNLYTPECFHIRNRYMVEHSCRLICYYDGKSGGTQYTVRLAQKQGLTIHNFTDQQLLLSGWN